MSVAIMLLAASREDAAAGRGSPGVPASASPQGLHAGGAILRRVAAGNLTAVQACMNRYGPLVWSLARRYTPSHEDAEDATQEIFTEIWKSADRYDATRGSEAVFITVLARRKLIDRARARHARIRTEPIGPEAEAQTDGAVSADDSETGLASRALAGLADQERELLLLSVVEGRSHSEIAAAKGLALGTVKTILRRALLKVRDGVSRGTEASANEERNS
jgi:RNA polymerase sigma-70 factor (ECF subfamily)